MVKSASQVSHIFTAEVAEFFPLLVTAQAGAVAQHFFVGVGLNM